MRKLIAILSLIVVSAWAVDINIRPQDLKWTQQGGEFNATFHIGSAPPVVTATGGNSTNDIYGYKTHTFTNDGTFTVSGGSLVCDVLIVGGGGGGGGLNVGGGGGGGGVLYLTNQTITGANSVTVGLGGLAGSAAPSNGYNSAFISCVATGGGAGGGAVGNAATSGGSGGGGQTVPGNGLAGQGFAGGVGTYSSPYTGGGGGGAWQQGFSYTDLYPDGGAGYNNDYGGGGGGGTYTGNQGLGGLGGGGNPGVYPVGDYSGYPGVVSTGGGGGGGGAGYGVGGKGGSGIVIVRYASTSAVAVATTSGLVSYWPLAGDLNDHTSTNNGTQVGTLVSTNGIKGLANTAYYFDGSSYLNVGLPTALNFTTGDFSISCWCYPSNMTSGTLISKGAYQVGGYYLNFSTGDRRYGDIYLITGAGDYLSAYNSKQTPAKGHWVHYAVVRSGISAISVYRNGVKGMVYSDNAANPATAAAYNFTIGAASDGGILFKGRIANVRVYSRALSDSEVAEIYAAEN